MLDTLGMHWNYGPNVNTNECDVLIAVGMRFDDRVTGNVSKYAKQAKVVHIDIVTRQRSTRSSEPMLRFMPTRKKHWLH